MAIAAGHARCRFAWNSLSAVFVTLAVLAGSSTVSPALAQDGSAYATADIGVTLEILDYTSDGAFAENLVRVSAVNRGPDDVSSFTVATCLSDVPPITVVDDFPGGCHSYGLVVPCGEFGLGFAFGALPAGQSMQCLARMRGPEPALPYALGLSVGRVTDANGAFMNDPDPGNDTIYLRPTGAPPSQLGTLSNAAALMLAGALAMLGRRRLRRLRSGC